MANPNNAQLRTLCERVDLLIMGQESLQQLLMERPNALNKAFANSCHVGATPPLEAVRTQFLPSEEFPIEDFLVLQRRDRTFLNLNNKIDTVLTRTEILRRYYNRTTQFFNRRLCELNHRGMLAREFSGIDDHLVNVNYLINVIDCLRKIIHAN